MTETLHEPPPSEPPPQPPTGPPSGPPSGPQPGPQPEARRLTRDPNDQVIAGVCAAFGRATGTDPVLWRVTVAVLALFGGAGLALYALGWVLLPRVGAPQSVAERTLRRPEGGISVGGVVLAVIGLVVLLALVDNGPGLLALVVIGGIVYLVARDRRSGAGATTAGAPPTYGTDTYGPPPTWSGPPSGPPPAYAPGPQAWVPPPPRPPRLRSPLGALTLFAAILTLGLLLLLNQVGVDGITGPRVLAGLVLVLGAGVLAGTWWGRARWVIPIGAVLALLLVPVALVDGSLAGGAGERTWIPSASDTRDTYELGVGEATLDLRQLEPGAVEELTADIGAGVMIVLVPADLAVRIEPRLGTGTLRTVVAGDTDIEQDDAPFERTDLPVITYGPPSDRVLDLRLHVGVGEIEVRRDQS